MSAEAKRVKICTLIELFLGLVLAVTGIVFAVGGAPTPAPLVACAEGALTLVLGVRGALIANVPARIGKLATLALVALLLQIACVAGVIYLISPENVANESVLTGFTAAPALVTLVILVLSRGMAKRAER